MEKNNKKIITLISNIKIDCVDRLGDLISPLLFKEQKCALFLSVKEKNVSILLPPNSSQEELHNKFIMLTDLVTLLKYLEKNRLIYIIPQEETYFSEFYYQNKQDYCKTQSEDIIKINKYEVLKNEMIKSVYRGGTIVLQTVNPITTVLYSDLMYYLNSIIYPTAELKKYIQRNFKSEELYISTKSIIISRISIVVAVVIAVLSPIITLYLSNKYGITKLDEIQFKKIINCISLENQNRVGCDTLIINNINE